MMRAILALIVALFVLMLCAGCAGLPQLDLKDGQVGCQTVTSVWVRGSNVVARADNTPKGSNAEGKTIIKCGEATMEVEHKIDRTLPNAIFSQQPGTVTTVTVPATTTTTTTQPAANAKPVP